MRTLRSRPFLSLIVVCVLGLAIGANTALYSIIDRLLLHPLPFRDLDRMVEIVGLKKTGENTGQSLLDLNYFANHVHALDRVVSWKWQNLILTGVDNPDYLYALEVSENAFDTLGVPPIIGRTLLPRDFTSTAAPVAVIGDKLWREHFHADPNIVGQQILLAGKGYTVAGVMGAEFVFDQPAIQVWIPQKPGTTPSDEPRHALAAIARLRPGVSIDQAQRELDAVMPGLPANPERYEGWHARLRPFTERYTGGYGKALLILWGAVGLVLLIACANAANLLLTRASERGREFAVRASLGASRFDLTRQILAETLLLGVAAGILGVALAFGLLRLLLLLFPEHQPIPQLDRVGIHLPALAVTGGIVLLTTLLCAIPAAVAAWRPNLAEALSASSRSASASRGANRARSAMIAFEVALSLILLTGAGLMLRTLERLLEVRLGFEPQHVLTARVSAPPQLRTKEQIAAHYSRMLAEVRALPGIQSAAITTILPFGNIVATVSFTAEGQTNPLDSRDTYLREVSPDYFSTLGLHLLRGRMFDTGDTARSGMVAIVNSELARRHWGDQDPIGKRVSGSDHPKADDWVTVVGVVENIKHRSLRTGADAEVYLPYTQHLIGAHYTYLAIRSPREPASIVSGLRKRIHELDPDQPVTEVKSMRTLVVDSAGEVRFHTLLLEIFAGLAFGLAITGIFAVVSYNVSQRAREIGIRSALGATPRDVIRFVLAIAMRPVLLGAGLGIAGALAATRLLQSELFETAPTDPSVFTVASAILIGAAALAASIPARRAIRIDPVEVLRSE